MKKTINNIFFDEGLNKLFGYDKLFNNFVTLFNTKKLPKVLILTGDKGIGKFTFIFHFINFVLSKQTKSSYDKENFSIQFDSDIIMGVEQKVIDEVNDLVGGDDTGSFNTSPYVSCTPEGVCGVG